MQQKRLVFISRLLFFASVPSFVCVGLAFSKPVSTESLKQMKDHVFLFQVVRELAEAVPFHRENVEKIVGVSLSEKSENEHFKFWAGSGALRSSTKEKADIDLRLHRTDAHRKGFLVFRYSGTCQPLKVIRAEFGELELTQTPRHGLPGESTSWSKQIGKCRVSFSFEESKPECLASIAFAPN